MSNQFYLFAIVATLSLLSWIIGKLREQAEIKRAKDEARRRQDEQLRTGRSSGAPAANAPAGASAQELAARRQAQLEALRKQQQINQRARAVGTAAPRPMGQPGGPPGGPRPMGPDPRQPGFGVPQTTTRGPTPLPGQQPQRPAARPQQAPQQQRKQNQQRGESSRQQRRIEVVAQPFEPPEPPPVVRRSAFAPPPPAAAPVHAEVRAGPKGLLFNADGRARSPAELRRAFALMEVLSPPLSMRDEQ
jgi:hypothetical protein